jgi:hypothetical protein
MEGDRKMGKEICIQRNRDAWTPKELLTAWGTVHSQEPSIGLSRSTSLKADASSDEMQAAGYVESTDGYHMAEPVLIHVHARCLRVEAFAITKPGEALLPAMINLGWMEFWEIRPARLIPGAVLARFEQWLAERCKAEPFWPKRGAAIVRDAQGVANQVHAPMKNRWGQVVTAMDLTDGRENEKK